ncbi:MAG: type VI secretion system tip protein VgrG [Bacteroidetes bacterium]|nr:MAG: type VI secretion system tip protein VgrG [Bacteroidota bacterium]
MPRNRTIPLSRTPSVVSSSVKINGEEIARTFLVHSIVVNKEINRIPRAKVILIDGDSSSGNFRASNDSLFIPGNEMEILSGYQRDVQTIFKGIIIKHSIKIRNNGTTALIVECRDKAIRMTTTRKSRHFYQLRDSEIFTNIGEDHNGIETRAEATTVTHKELVQFQTSDWDFIVTRAEVNGKMCFADDGQLEIKAPNLNQDPALSLVYGATILELDAEMDGRDQLQNGSSKAWDYAEQQVTEKEADSEPASLNGNISSEQLAQAMGFAPYVQAHGGKREETELQAWSNALMLKRKLAKIRGKVKCTGVHDVKPGNMIELQGIGERFNGRTFVSGIQHHIADGTWQMDIQFGCDPEWFTEKHTISQQPASGLLAAVSGLQVGIVEQLNDPDSEDRLKLKLPLAGTSDEGIWARIASLDAGNERGAFFRPEIGDEVIVGFINDDPRDAVVLGMLNSSAKPAPFRANDDNHLKGFVSRSGMKLVFDDDKKSVTVETPSGKKITADEDKGEIKLSDEHGNTIAMDSNGITLESARDIKIKSSGDFTLEGMRVDIKASASLTAEGSAGTNIKSSGITEIKGSLVRIN